MGVGWVATTRLSGFSRDFSGFGLGGSQAATRAWRGERVREVRKETSFSPFLEKSRVSLGATRVRDARGVREVREVREESVDFSLFPEKSKVSLGATRVREA